MKPIMLRDYQQEMKNRMAEAWESHRSVMVQMPTGTGKTHLLDAVEFVVLFLDNALDTAYRFAIPLCKVKH